MFCYPYPVLLKPEKLAAHLSPPHPCLWGGEGVNALAALAGLSVSHLWLKPIFLCIHALQVDELASKFMILVSTALQRVGRSNLPNDTHSREGRSELEQVRRNA